MILPSPRAIVPSLHDVSPRTHAICARALTELATLGASKVSLLVIPDHHHSGHFLRDAAFCKWLRDCVKAGHEVVIHGYFHQRTPKLRESARELLTTRFYTAGEGEFFDVDHATARQLVLRAQTDFAQLELAPSGFIAPAWLLSPSAEAALRELGLAYTTRIGGVLDLQSRQTHCSQSLVWSVRSAWRRWLSLAWNAALFRRLAARPLLRIGIHPVDLAHGAIWRQIRHLLTRALVDREALTYEGWLAQTRLAITA